MCVYIYMYTKELCEIPKCPASARDFPSEAEDLANKIVYTTKPPVICH